jgi:hypothetical protein
MKRLALLIIALQLLFGGNQKGVVKIAVCEG